MDESSGCETTKNRKISMVNQWVGRLGSAVRMRANKYVLREVWKSVIVPSMYIQARRNRASKPNNCLGPRAGLGPQTTTGYELNATTNCMIERPLKFCDGQCIM